MIKQILAAALVLGVSGPALAQPAPQEQLGALAPANLKKPRPKAPFDLTGTWFVDLSKGFDTWRSGPPYPKFKGEGAKAFAESEQARRKARTTATDIGQCYPAGMPVIMTRVWPIAMIQMPTADLHGQRLRERAPHHLPRRPQAHAEPTKSSARFTANRSAAGKATRWSWTPAT